MAFTMSSFVFCLRCKKGPDHEGTCRKHAGEVTDRHGCFDNGEKARKKRRKK